MNDILPFAILLIFFGFGLMVLRDYRNVKKSIRNRPHLNEFLDGLDNHDPTPYDKIVGIDQDKV